MVNSSIGQTVRCWGWWIASRSVIAQSTVAGLTESTGVVDRRAEIGYPSSMPRPYVDRCLSGRIRHPPPGPELDRRASPAQDHRRDGEEFCMTDHFLELSRTTTRAGRAALGRPTAHRLGGA